MNYTVSQVRERAERAKQILNDDLFAEMLTELRQDAFIKLAGVPADDAGAIRDQQAVVKVTDEIRDRLAAMVLATGQDDGGYSMTDSPQGD